MKSQKNPLKQILTILSSLSCLVIIGTFIEVKSINHQEVLAEAESIAKAEAESIAKAESIEKAESIAEAESIANLKNRYEDAEYGNNDDSSHYLTTEEYNEVRKRGIDYSDDSDDSDDGYGNNYPGYHTVEGHYRTNSDGNTTYVDGYTRSNPDGDLSNNLSSPN